VARHARSLRRTRACPLADECGCRTGRLLPGSDQRPCGSNWLQAAGDLSLTRSGSIDRIEYGKFFEKVKTRPVALADRKGRPVVVTARHPVVVKDATGTDVPDAVFMVTVADREEKGSDVNVACHLLIDTLLGHVDAAIAVSNDSDLALAISQARERIPVGVVNPTRRPTAGSLKSRPAGGPPDQWEYQLTAADFIAHQLPDPCEGIIKPPTW
jgi:hypothetical protein